MKKLTIRISENEHKDLKIKATKQGKSITEVVILMIKNWLKKG